MSCFHPLSAYRSLEVGPSGKRGIVFKSEDGLSGTDLKLPCGKCIGCLSDRARSWAIRCMHEAKSHVDNCFLTLTYDDEHLPKDNSVRLSVVQKFIKATRQKMGKFSFFACGEYGEGLGRPHYHMILFGLDFPDKLHEKGVGENRLYSSKLLSKLWPNGFALIGSVTFESAAYVARYVLKKKFGDAQRDHYVDLDRITGELKDLCPEFITMSRRPPIGGLWFQKYVTDVYGAMHDGVYVDGREHPAPPFYDKQLEKVDPELYEIIKARRMNVSDDVVANSTPRRLRDREEVAEARNALFNKRSYENG